MSRSWKYTPIYKDGSKRSRNKKFYKRLANKRVRRTKHLHGRKSMYYKEVQDSKRNLVLSIEYYYLPAHSLPLAILENIKCKGRNAE